MKQILSIVALAAISLQGCTTYPKQYNYSPTVTINGNNNEAVNLPSPFAKGFPKPVRAQKEQPQPRNAYAGYNPNGAPSRYLYNPTTGELYDTNSAIDFNQRPF